MQIPRNIRLDFRKTEPKSARTEPKRFYFLCLKSQTEQIKSKIMLAFPNPFMIGAMIKSKSTQDSADVIDEPVLTDEELKRLATIFDVLIDVDFYLNYTKGTEQ